MRPSDDQVPGTPCGSGDWVMDGLLSDTAARHGEGVRLTPVPDLCLFPRLQARRHTEDPQRSALVRS